MWNSEPSFIQELTSLELSERRSTLLYHAIEQLSACSDSGLMASRLGQILVPEFGELFILDWSDPRRPGLAGPGSWVRQRVLCTDAAIARRVDALDAMPPEESWYLSSFGSASSGSASRISQFEPLLTQPSRIPSPTFNLLEQASLNSVLVIPLQVDQELVGVATIASARSSTRWGDVEICTIREVLSFFERSIERIHLLHRARDGARKREEALSVASHELKNPLTALKLRAQLLQKELLGLANELPALQRARVLSSKVVADVDRFSSLIHELLEVTRIQSDQFKLAFAEVDLSELVREVVGTYEDQGLVLNVNAQEVRGQWDRVRLTQVITNLVSNAVKYGGGHPVEIVLTQQTQGDVEVAVLSIRDQGVGIPPNEISLIFHQFERASSSDGIPGLGLGLYVVKQIIEAHRGTIDVKSELGRGSTFTVTLPLCGS